MTIKEHNELTLYSGIAIIFVIFIHANGYYINAQGISSYKEAGYLVEIIDNIVHIAVAMFIFIAGYKYFLFSSAKNTSNYFDFAKKKLKLLKTFFIFSISLIFLSLVCKILLGSYNSQQINPVFFMNQFWSEFLKTFSGKSFPYQLWFIPMYLFVTLTFPLISRIIKSLELKFHLFWYLL